jgi:hypothetical protein
LRAIGAAISAPQPAFSTTMATTIFGLSAGAKAVYSALSRRRSASAAALYFSLALMPTTCAVPVLPPEV